MAFSVDVISCWIAARIANFCASPLPAIAATLISRWKFRIAAASILRNWPVKGADFGIFRAETVTATATAALIVMPASMATVAATVTDT